MFEDLFLFSTLKTSNFNIVLFVFRNQLKHFAYHILMITIIHMYYILYSRTKFCFDEFSTYLDFVQLLLFLVL